MALNRHLLAFLQSQSEFKGFDTFQMMIFLYENMSPKKGEIAPPEVEQPSLPDSVAPPVSNRSNVFISYSHENKEELARSLESS